MVKDVDRAVDMYKRAALAGNAVGANNLAISYYNRKEHMDAANWYMTAFYLISIHSPLLSFHSPPHTRMD